MRKWASKRLLGDVKNNYSNVSGGRAICFISYDIPASVRKTLDNGSLY